MLQQLREEYQFELASDVPDIEIYELLNEYGL